MSSTQTTDPRDEMTDKSTWRLSKAFWTANVVELFERAAWYGVFVAITL